MSNETIPLSKPLNLKAYAPGEIILASEKYDGVPIRVDVLNGKAHAVTRQAKPVTSCDHLVEACWDMGPGTYVMEVQLPGRPFKESSGAVRRNEPNTQLVGRVFDFLPPNGYELDLDQRLAELRRRYSDNPSPFVWPARQTLVAKAQLEQARDLVSFLCAHCDIDNHPLLEGFILRSADERWSPGKRVPTYQKVLDEPTLDLKIVGFTEAHSAAGKRLRMVGGLIANYKAGTVGVGPGKLTHRERKALWEDFWAGANVLPRIAQVKVKKDASYDGLRQPTFQHWRDDKTEPNEET